MSTAATLLRILRESNTRKVPTPPPPVELPVKGFGAHVPKFFTLPTRKES